MKILYWDSESKSINEFLSAAKSIVNLVHFEEFEEIDSLIDEEEPDAILFDYDINKKQVEKEIKYIKKHFEEIKIILLSNVLTTKQLAKHQSSKVGADIYLRTPLSSKIISSIFSQFFDLDSAETVQVTPKTKPVLRTLNVVDDEISDDMDELENQIEELSDEEKSFQEKILAEHTGVENVDPEAKRISDEMDLIFKEAFPETESETKAAIVLADIEKAESEDFLNDIEDISLDDLDTESAEEVEDTLSLSLDDDELSDPNSTSDFDLEAMNDETILPENDDLAFPDEDDLGFPDDIDNNIAQEEPDMSGHDESELSLDGMDDLEIASENSELETFHEEDGMELDLSSDDSLDLSDGEDSGELVAQVDDGSLDLGDSADEIEFGDTAESIEVVADELELGSDLGDIEETDDASVAIVEDTIDIGTEEESLELGADEEESLDFGADDEGGLDLGASEDESLDLGADEEDGLDFGSSDEDGLDLGADEEESLDLGADEEDGLDFGDEDALDFGSDDNSVDADSINLATEEEIGISDDDLEFGVSEEDSTDESHMSSNELPHAPDGIEDNDLSFNTGITENLENDKSDLSTDVMVKLAEIDAMMMDSGDSDSSDDINITQINDDLIAANSEDETVIADANDYNLNDTENSSIEEEVVDEIQVPEIQSPEVQAPVLNNNINSDVLRDHEMIKGHHSDELMRLGETIKNLQDDREQLLSRVKDLEELQGTKERNSISVKAELDEKKIEISILRKRYVQQIEDMKVQLEISNEKKEILSEKNKQFESEYENLRRKIRVDLNKVKSRENELEGKLEMLRSDADIQIRNRDQKILELKRKIDTLEFDNESIQTKGQKIVNNKYELEGKMEKVIQTLRSAIGELEDDTAMARTIKDVKKNLDV